MQRNKDNMTSRELSHVPGPLDWGPVCQLGHLHVAILLAAAAWQLIALRSAHCPVL